MNRGKGLLFLLFFISGLCGLLYQVVWLRLAFAAFGVITPVVSVVVSVFMLGLALGSWGGGFWFGRESTGTKLSPLVYYAGIELLIGAGSFAVPFLFSRSEQLLLNLTRADSFSYLFASAVLLSFSILPWCICMGATYPAVM